MNHFKLIMYGTASAPPKGRRTACVEGGNGELAFTLSATATIMLTASGQTTLLQFCRGFSQK